MSQRVYSFEWVSPPNKCLRLHCLGGIWECLYKGMWSERTRRVRKETKILRVEQTHITGLNTLCGDLRQLIQLFFIPTSTHMRKRTLTLQQLLVQRSRQNSGPAALHFLGNHDVGADLWRADQSYSAMTPHPLWGPHNLQNLREGQGESN